MNKDSLLAIFEKMERQLVCSDAYAKEQKSDVLPSIWEIQNIHIRDLLVEARSELDKGFNKQINFDNPKIKPQNPNMTWEDLAQAMRESYDAGEKSVSLNHLCFLLGWEIVPGKPAQEATETKIIVKENK